MTRNPEDKPQNNENPPLVLWKTISALLSTALVTFALNLPLPMRLPIRQKWLFYSFASCTDLTLSVFISNKQWNTYQRGLNGLRSSTGWPELNWQPQPCNLSRAPFGASGNLLRPRPFLSTKRKLGPAFCRLGIDRQSKSDTRPRNC